MRARSRPPFCDRMDCSPPGCSVHEASQARILEWGTISFSGGIFLTQGSNPCLVRLLPWQADSLPLARSRAPPARKDPPPAPTPPSPKRGSGAKPGITVLTLRDTTRQQGSHLLFSGQTLLCCAASTTSRTPTSHHARLSTSATASHTQGLEKRVQLW